MSRHPRRPSPSPRLVPLILAAGMTLALALTVLPGSALPLAARYATPPAAQPVAPQQVVETATPTATSTNGATPTGTSTATPTGTPDDSPDPDATPTPTSTGTLTPTATQPAGVTSGTANQCTGEGNTPDIYEQPPGDNTQGNATELASLPAVQTHNLCSTTAGPDEDWFVFTGETSRRYTVETSDLSAVVDTFVLVIGPEGFLVQDDDSGSGLGSRIVFTPEEDGEFFIRVTQASKTPFLLSETSQRRDYTITVSSAVAPTPTPTLTAVPATATHTPTPSPCRDEFEGNGTRGSAKGLFVNKPQRHVLCGDGDVDWVWFDAVANKPYRIYTSNLAAGVDTLMVLYAPDQTTIVHINDDYPGLGLASRIDLTASVTARYFLKLQDSAGHGAEDFSYMLHLESDGMPNDGPCEDEFEPDGMPADAPEILLGETVAHSFCPEGDADWVRFRAIRGKTYTLATSNLTVGTDTLLVVFGPDSQTIVAQDDDSGGGLASRVDFAVPTDGFYYAQIKNAGDIGGRTQRYTLAFTAAGAQPATPTTAATPSDTRTPTRTPTRTTTPSGTRTSSSGGDVTLAASISGTPVPVSGGGFADPGFATIWARTDEPVSSGRAERSWYWGITPGPGQWEPYKGAADGVRLVQYFDKARMEINDPAASRASPWFVTNGRLVHEMISGLVQVGHSATEQRKPARVALAGDGGSGAATYASLAPIASLDNDRRVPNRTGQVVAEQVMATGKITVQPELSYYVVNAYYVPETGHNIPNVFWSFLQQQGVVQTADGYRQEIISDWLTTFGLPLTEAYWMRVTVDGVQRDVLVQAFERRILTYNPSNSPAWQVEMGNVGLHYYHWRYGA